MKQSLIKKSLIFLLSFVHLTQNVFATLSESEMWKERHEAIQRTTAQVQNTQLAFLPQNIFNHLPSVHPSLPTALVTSEKNIKKSTQLSSKFKSLVDSIPQTAGIIQSVYDSGNLNNPPLILVQDIHLNPEAQTNVASILQTLINDKQLTLIGVEGSFSKFNLATLRAFPDQKITDQVAKEFLDKNKLAAPSYVGVTSKIEPPLFLGIDDLEHHIANVQAYLSTRRLKQKTQQHLLEIEIALTSHKQKAFSPKLKKFDEVQTSYHKGKMGLGAYVKHLASYDVDKDLLIEQFLEASNMESTLNFQRVDEQRKIVIDKLAQVMSPTEQNNLLTESLAYRLGRMGFGVYYQNLKKLCAAKNIELRNYPDFDGYIRYVLLSDGIRPEALFSSVALMEQRIMKSLDVNSREQELLAQSEQLMLMGKLIDFSLTSQEWQRYKFLCRGDTSGRPNGVIRPTNFEKFYEEADIRSQKMVLNILRATTNPTPAPAPQGRGTPTMGNRATLTVPLPRGERTGEGIAVALVVGGFHTTDITAELRKKQISYIVVSPKITKVDTENGSAYLSVFAREKTPLDKLLSGEKLFLAPTELNFTANNCQQDFNDRREEVAHPLNTTRWLRSITWNRVGTSLKLTVESVMPLLTPDQAFASIRIWLSKEAIAGAGYYSTLFGITNVVDAARFENRSILIAALTFFATYFALAPPSMQISSVALSFVFVVLAFPALFLYHHLGGVMRPDGSKSPSDVKLSLQASAIAWMSTWGIPLFVLALHGGALSYVIAYAVGGLFLLNVPHVAVNQRAKNKFYTDNNDNDHLNANSQPVHFDVYFSNGLTSHERLDQVQKIYRDVDTFISPDAQQKIWSDVQRRKSNLSITLVFPTTNSMDYIEYTLYSMKKSIEQASSAHPGWTIEIVVALNGVDQEETFKKIREIQDEFNGQIQFTILKVAGTGKVLGMNAGVQYARSNNSDIVGFIDDDVVYSKGALEKTVEQMVDNKILMAGPKRQPAPRLDPNPTLFQRFVFTFLSNKPRLAPMGPSGQFMLLKTYPGLPQSIINDDSFLLAYFARPDGSSDWLNRVQNIPGAFGYFEVSSDWRSMIRRRKRIDMGDRQLLSIFGPHKNNAVYWYSLEPGVQPEVMEKELYSKLTFAEKSDLKTLRRGMARITRLNLFLIDIRIWLRSALGHYPYVTQWFGDQGSKPIQSEALKPVASIFYQHYLDAQKTPPANLKGKFLARLGDPLGLATVWEVIFFVLVPIAQQHFSDNPFLIGVAWITSAELFAQAHIARNSSQKPTLFLLGLGLGAAFFVPGMTIFMQVMLSILIHLIYNVIVLTVQRIIHIILMKHIFAIHKNIADDGNEKYWPAVRPDRDEKVSTDLKNYLSHNSNPDRHFQFIMKDGKIAGYVSYHIIGDADKSVTIDLLAVDPKFKKQGIGAELMLRVFEFAQQNKISTISLNAYKINEDGNRFYRNLSTRPQFQNKVTTSVMENVPTRKHLNTYTYHLTSFIRAEDSSVPRTKSSISLLSIIVSFIRGGLPTASAIPVKEFSTVETIQASQDDPAIIANNTPEQLNILLSGLELELTEGKVYSSTLDLETALRTGRIEGDIDVRRVPHQRANPFIQNAKNPAIFVYNTTTFNLLLKDGHASIEVPTLSDPETLNPKKTIHGGIDLSAVEEIWVDQETFDQAHKENRDLEQAKKPLMAHISKLRIVPKMSHSEITSTEKSLFTKGLLSLFWMKKNPLKEIPLFRIHVPLFEKNQHLNIKDASGKLVQGDQLAAFKNLITKARNGEEHLTLTGLISTLPADTQAERLKKALTHMVRAHVTKPRGLEAIVSQYGLNENEGIALTHLFLPDLAYMKKEHLDTMPGEWTVGNIALAWALILTLIPVVIIFSLSVFILIEDFFIYVTTGTPIESPFFLQRRIGLHGKEFTIFKLRTMKKVRGMNQITKIGRFLRKSSLDELPQLANIAIGDMVFFGLRPLLRKEIILGYESLVLSRRPGLLSLNKMAQGFGTSQGGPERNLVHDILQGIRFNEYELRHWGWTLKIQTVTFFCLRVLGVMNKSLELWVSNKVEHMVEKEFEEAIEKKQHSPEILDDSPHVRRWVDLFSPSAQGSPKDADSDKKSGPLIHSENTPIESIFVSDQDALQYQAEVRKRFVAKGLEAEEQFNPAKTSQEKVDADIRNTVVSRDVLFHHVLLTGRPDIRQVYDETMKIVKDVLGDAVPLIEISFDEEIHVTIASDDVAPSNQIVLTLDQLERDLLEDTRGVQPFKMELIGPHLMKNGVVVMEYTTTAPEFLYLRKKADWRRTTRPLSKGNQGYTPNLIHSSPCLINGSVGQSKLQELKHRLDTYRNSLKAVEANIDKITVTHLRQPDRRFLESRDILLGGGTTPTVPWMKLVVMLVSLSPFYFSDSHMQITLLILAGVLHLGLNAQRIGGSRLENLRSAIAHNDINALLGQTKVLGLNNRITSDEPLTNEEVEELTTLFTAQVVANASEVNVKNPAERKGSHLFFFDGKNTTLVGMIAALLKIGLSGNGLIVLDTQTAEANAHEAIRLLKKFGLLNNGTIDILVDENIFAQGALTEQKLQSNVRFAGASIIVAPRHMLPNNTPAYFYVLEDLVLLNLNVSHLATLFRQALISA